MRRILSDWLVCECDDELCRHAVALCILASVPLACVALRNVIL